MFGANALNLEQIFDEVEEVVVLGQLADPLREEAGPVLPGFVRDVAAEEGFFVVDGKALRKIVNRNSCVLCLKAEVRLDKMIGDLFIETVDTLERGPAHGDKTAADGFRLFSIFGDFIGSEIEVISNAQTIRRHIGILDRDSCDSLARGVHKTRILEVD